MTSHTKTSQQHDPAFAPNSLFSRVRVRVGRNEASAPVRIDVLRRLGFRPELANKGVK